MEPERWHRITGVFHQALSLDDASRRTFLDRACGDDVSLRAEVEALLAAERRAGQFGDAPLAWSAGPSAIDADAGSGEHESESVRHRPHPFVWAVWLAALVSASAFAYGAALFFIRTDTSVGWTEQRRNNQWYIEAVDPGGPASTELKRGDRIVALNGEAPAPGPGTRFLRFALSVGERYALTVDRNGERHEARLLVVSDRRPFARRLTFFFISLIWCGVGLFVGFARPGQMMARLAFGGAVATGLAYLSGAVLQTGPVWGPLHAVLGYQFFCWFPSDRRPAAGVRWTIYALYALAIPASLLGMWITLTIVTAGPAAGNQLVAHRQTLFPIVRGAFSWVVYGGVFFGMAAVTWFNYRSLTDEDARRRVRWVALCTVVTLLPQGWDAALAAFGFFVGPAGLPFLGSQVDVFSVAIPVSVAYAVVRHRVFDITVVVRRGLQYLLARHALQALTAIPLVAVAATLVTNRNQTIAQLAIETRGYLYWSVAAALMLRFRGPARTWLDRKFFRQEYDREQVLLALVDDLASVESLSDLSRMVVDRIESALHPKSIYLWHREADALTLAHSSPALPAGTPITGSHRLMSWLEGCRGPILMPPPPGTPLSNAERRWLRGLDVAIAVPLADSTERLVGALMLGEKKSEEPYGARDQQLLQAVAMQAAVVRENLQLRAQVTDEQRIRRDVLANLGGQPLDILKECPACGTCYDAAADRCERDGETLTLSLPVPRTIADRYRLDALIGRGGMGAVYAARDLRLGRPVAVKILIGAPFGRELRLRRFEREARTAARLNHPNVVRVYDFGTLDTGAAYLVMERVEGVTLRAELNRAGMLAAPAVAEWFAPLLEGLAAAHAGGIVHRDLKPENVVGRRGDDRALSVKLLDFGLAKALAVDGASLAMSLTADGAAVGTSGYMSPEQILGRDVDHRTDIFAVGVMVVEAVSGQRPFPGTTYAEIARAVLDGDCRIPSACGGSLDPVVRRCMSLDAERRFSSAAELREALLPALQSTSV